MTGTLPPTVRVREFLASQDPKKREKLIETLLDSPEYVEYWTFRFADIFRVARYANSNMKPVRAALGLAPGQHRAQQTVRSDCTGAYRRPGFRRRGAALFSGQRSSQS